MIPNAGFQRVKDEYCRLAKPAIAVTSGILTILFELWLSFGIWLGDTLEDAYHAFKNPT